MYLFSFSSQGISDFVHRSQFDCVERVRVGYRERRAFMDAYVCKQCFTIQNILYRTLDWIVNWNPTNEVGSNRNSSDSFGGEF